MKLTPNKFYKLTFNIKNNLITFTCKVLSDDGGFIEFIDKFGEKLTYSKRYLVLFKEINESELNFKKGNN